MTRWCIYLQQTVFCLSVMMNVHASNDHYQVPVRISANTTVDSDAIIQDAFENVLVKVTGTRSILRSKVLQKYRPKAHEMVLNPSVLKTRSNLSGFHTVMLAFNPKRIQEVLLAADQDAWTGKRPSIILWLVNSDPNSDQIYHLDNQPHLASLIRNVSLERGISVTCPLFDLEDMTKISAQEIRAANLERIHLVSNRYDMGFELLGQVRPFEQSTQIDWILVQAFSQQPFSTSGPDMLTALRSGLDEAIDRMAKRYARHISAPEDEMASVALTVQAINDIETYTQVLEYIRHLSILQQVDIERIGEKEVTLRMRVKGGRSRLVRVFMEDGVLKPLKEGSALQNLRYEYVSPKEVV